MAYRIHPESAHGEIMKALTDKAQAESVLMGLPAKVGVIVLWGQLLDITFDWDSSRYLAWSLHVERLYGTKTVELYGRISEHVKALGPMMDFLALGIYATTGGAA